MLMIEPGTKKGETALCDFCSKSNLFLSILYRPPIPEPILTPTFAASRS